MRTIGLFSFASALCFIGGAGAQDGVKADIRGQIAKLTPTKDAKVLLGTLLVEGDIEKGITGYDKAWVKITPKTKIEKLVGKDRKPATFDDLKVGARVQVNFTGPVAESYPVQASAGDILILEAAKEAKK